MDSPAGVEVYSESVLNQSRYFPLLVVPFFVGMDTLPAFDVDPRSGLVKGRRSTSYAQE